MTRADPESSRDMWANRVVTTADLPTPGGPQTYASVGSSPLNTGSR
jgi:hypothetical protein